MKFYSWNPDKNKLLQQERGISFEEIVFHIQSGDEIQFDLVTGIVINVTRNETYQANQLPPVMLAIMQEGGLVAYLKKHKDFILS
jgi:3-isopropylmalate dehydratase small subunit